MSVFCLCIVYLCSSVRCLTVGVVDVCCTPYTVSLCSDTYSCVSLHTSRMYHNDDGGGGGVVSYCSGFTLSLVLSTVRILDFIFANILR